LNPPAHLGPAKPSFRSSITSGRELERLAFRDGSRKVKLRAAAGIRSRKDPVTWRKALRRHLTLLLLAKFAALVLLWALCFSPAHRTFVDGEVASRRLALVQPHAAPRPVAPLLQENSRD
jgi:hypothetical protein